MVPDREILLYTKSVYGATPDIKIDAKSLYSVGHWSQRAYSTQRQSNHVFNSRQHL